jgi:hypothetical protein
MHGMNGGKVSLFHVFWANLLTLHDVNSSPGNRGFPHWLIRLYILTTTAPKITTQCPFFAPGLCLAVVDIKFAVKQISQF